MDRYILRKKLENGIWTVIESFETLLEAVNYIIIYDPQREMILCGARFLLEFSEMLELLETEERKLMDFNSRFSLQIQESNKWYSLGHFDDLKDASRIMGIYDPDGTVPMRVWDTDKKAEILLRYTISVQNTSGWEIVYNYYHENDLDVALNDLECLSQSNSHDAFRLCEHRFEIDDLEIIAEYYPEGYVQGPENEPISWLESGF